MHAPVLSAQARSLIEVDLEIGAFVASWNHCDQTANYLARTVSFERTDSFLYSNLFSTVLNELLEIVFYQHKPGGRLLCTILRDGLIDRIELNIPVGAAERAFYRKGVDEARSMQAGDLYTRSLLGESALSPSVGLLELAADYNAKMWLDAPESDERLRLTVEISLETTHPSLPEV